MTPFSPFRVSVYREVGPLRTAHEMAGGFVELDQSDPAAARKLMMTEILLARSDAYDCGAVEERMRAARELRTAPPPEPARVTRNAGRGEIDLSAWND